MFDSLTIAAVADELNRRACPAKIQRVLTLSPLAIGLELYAQGQRQQLIISAHADNARVHLSDHNLTRDPALNDSQLLLLLRKYVRGGRLLSVAQPDLERVLLLSIAKLMPVGKYDDSNYTQSVNSPDADSDDDEDLAGEEVAVQLVVEMMGRHSNIILVDGAGVIMDSLKRVPSSVNRYRVIIPHHPYVAPPAQDKRRFDRMSEAAFQEAVAAAAQVEGKKKAGQLWQGLVGALQGASPQMAKEIVYRATGLADTLATDFTAWPALHTAADELFSLNETGRWQPCVVYQQPSPQPSPIALNNLPPQPSPVAGEGEETTLIPLDYTPPQLYLAAAEGNDATPSTKDDIPPQPYLAAAEGNDATPSPISREGWGEGAKAIAFASYRLRHLEGAGRLVANDSISATVEAYFSSVEQTAAHEQLKEQLRGRVAGRRQRIASRLHSLREQLTRADEAEMLRYKGEMIFAYQYAIGSDTTNLSVPAPAGEDEISIALDPQLSVAENAQRYFRDYHKATAARAGLPERVADAEQDLAYLDEMAAMIDLAEGYEDITLTARELADLDKPPAPPKPGKQKANQKAKAGLPPGLGKLLRVVSPDGIEIFVGKSMKQNEYIAFKLAAPDDIWLHARGVPGAHVLVKMRGVPVLPQRTLIYAAGLAAGRSQARHNGAAEVMYTAARHLRKPPGAPPGTLLFSHEKSIRVPPILAAADA